METAFNIFFFILVSAGMIGVLYLFVNTVSPTMGAKMKESFIGLKDRIVGLFKR